jgi:membrane protein insertase Oxa1/YidC/SpoIIIJ
MKATGVVGSILVILALIITFLKQVIAFIGFLTFAIKIIVVVVFVALLIGVGLLVLRSFKSSRKAAE